jgi:hypothetical protein
MGPRVQLLLMNDKFLKLHTIEQFMQAVKQQRKLLFQELVNNATDDVIFMRRFRMISQINYFESQGINKIYNFETDDYDDYIHGLSILLSELTAVASKNA